MRNESNAINFENQIFFVGIDVHKNKWVVTVRFNKMELQTFAMEPKPKTLVNHLQNNYPGGIYKSVYEAGFSGFWAHRELVNRGVDNCVINAADVPTTNKEKVTKTDKVDSRKLARELENYNLNAIYIPEIDKQQLRSLSRLRFAMTRNSTRLKNRIKSHLCYNGIELPPNCELQHWSRNFIRYLENISKNKCPNSDYLQISIDELKFQRKNILKVIRELRQYIKEYKQHEVFSLLLTIPGIGPITAITLISEIIDMKRFKKLDNLCSFVGIVPSCNSSGEKESIGKLVNRRNKYLRHLLIEASWIAVRKDPILLETFTKLCRRMKKSKAIVVISKKLLNRIRFVWKNNKPYQCKVNTTKN